MADDHIARLESKVDRLAEAVNKLVLIEERANAQAARLSALEHRVGVGEDAHRRVERKVDLYINRAVGAAAVVTILWSIAQVGAKFIGVQS